MTENLTNGKATYPIWNTSRNIYCHPDELRFLHCIVALCDCMMKRGSQVQGGCSTKWIGGTLKICKFIKPGEVAEEKCHHFPSAQSVVIHNDFILF